jgi:hypothetical protein
MSSNTGYVAIASGAAQVFTPSLCNDFMIYSQLPSASVFIGASNANFIQVSSNFTYTSNLQASNLTVGGTFNLGSINTSSFKSGILQVGNGIGGGGGGLNLGRIIGFQLRLSLCE